MPTVYKFPKKSLPFKKPKDRDIALWEKHRKRSNKDPHLPKHRDK